MSATEARVLIIEDNDALRAMLFTVLRHQPLGVDTAIGAEDALEKAQAGRYSLFLVDVEMPGIDGFEFVSRTRAHPVLREVPAILVTSRASADDRRRGEESGARAYIVKSEFEQNRFLETVRQLVSQ